MLGNDFINILSEGTDEGYFRGMITEDFLRTVIPDFSGLFYVCGPEPMIESVLRYLENLGAGKQFITIEL